MLLLHVLRARQFDEDHNFIDPVVQKWPVVAREYRSKIKEPMDIVTMLQNVRLSRCCAVAVRCVRGLRTRAVECHARLRFGKRAVATAR